MDKQIKKREKIFLIIFSLLICLVLVSAFNWGRVETYYDWNSTTEIIDGVYNFTIMDGAPTFTDTNCLIGNCTSVSLDNNFNISSNNFTDICDGIGTICHWIRPTDVTDVVISSFEGNIMNLYTSGDGSTIYWDTLSAVFSADVNVWQDICMRNNGTNLSLFINGSEVAIGDNAGCEDTSVQYCLGAKCSLASGDDYSGLIDESLITNISLTNAEILERYNSGSGIPYDDASLNVTLGFPDDDYLLNDTNFNMSFLIDNANSYNLTNVSLIIENLNGVEIDREIRVYGITNTTINQSINIDVDNYGFFNYYVSVDYISGASTLTITSDTKGFYNAITINIRNDEGSLISGASGTINGIDYLSNPMIYPISSMSGNTTQNVTINASASGYNSNLTYLFINRTESSIYNISLSNHNLWLYFYQNGSAINISGYATDLNKSIVFSNTSYFRDQNDFDNSIVYIRLLEGVHNGTNFTWDNKTQFYEYNNEYPRSVNESIEIFQNIDTSSYFQVQDNSQNSIRGAIIRLYGVVPVNYTSGQTNYSFYGQRIVDDDGKSVFPLDSQAEIYLVVSATGYQSRTIRLTASEITTFTESNPKIIRLNQASYSGEDNIFIGGLYKLEGNYVFESKFDNVSSNYYLFIFDNYRRSLTYSTSYEGLNRTIELDSANIGRIDLISGQQFNNGANDSFIIYLYADESLAYTIPINFANASNLDFINIDDIGLRDNETWRFLSFFILVLIAMIMALFIETPSQDIGIHIFMIGSFALPFLVDGMGWVTFCGAVFYLGKLTQKWVSE